MSAVPSSSVPLAVQVSHVSFIILSSVCFAWNYMNRSALRSSCFSTGICHGKPRLRGEQRLRDEQRWIRLWREAVFSSHRMHFMVVVVVAFPSLTKILGVFDHLFSACDFFLLLFLSEDWLARTNSTLYMTGCVHSGSASWDDCGWMFPDKLRVSSFPDRVPHYAWTAA